MDSLERPDVRIRKTRRHAWLLAVVISMPLSYVLALIRAPGAPWWLGLACGVVATPMVGFLLMRAMTASTSDLLFARLGTMEERRQRLAEPPSRYAPAATRAALAIEVGDLGYAASLLGGVRALDRKQPLFRLVEQRQLLATGVPATQARAVDSLLAWRSLMRFGLHDEIARYHAFVLASALAARPANDPKVVAAVARLRADKDLEVKAYATWLSADDDEYLVAGAVLARAAGFEPLAKSLELRAARLASGEGQRAPYRAP